MPPQCRDKPLQPGDPQSKPAGRGQKEREVGLLHIELYMGNSKDTGKGSLSRGERGKKIVQK